MQSNNETKSIFATDKRLLFVLLCVLTLFLLYFKKTFIEYETAAFEFLQDRPEGFVLKMLSMIQFLSIPLVYFWKFTVIAFVIWIGCFSYGYRVTFAQCWGVVIGAEFVFLIPEVIKIFYFFFIETDPSYSDIGAFYPLSLMHFFDYYAIDAKWAYPLRALNLFEVVYCFALVAGIHHYARKDKKVVWFIVLSSYVFLFLLWLVFYVIVYK
jgi:hypothetical protein